MFLPLCIGDSDLEESSDISNVRPQKLTEVISFKLGASGSDHLCNTATYYYVYAGSFVAATDMVSLGAPLAAKVAHVVPRRTELFTDSAASGPEMLIAHSLHSQMLDHFHSIPKAKEVV